MAETLATGEFEKMQIATGGILLRYGLTTLLPNGNKLTAEEWPMWAKLHGVEFDEFAERSAQVMREVDVFKDSMRKALEKWPNSSAHNLSARSKNRKAWLGHAGCYMANESPESATRSGWWQLDNDEQIAANIAADEVIKEWEDAQT